jgi:hypothetical protein
MIASSKIASFALLPFLWFMSVPLAVLFILAASSFVGVETLLCSDYRWLSMEYVRCLDQVRATELAFAAFVVAPALATTVWWWSRRAVKGPAVRSEGK